MHRALLAVLASSILPLSAPRAPLPAQEPAPAEKSAPKPEPHELRFESRHLLDSLDPPRTISAVAETTLLRDEEGKAEAEFFSISYTVDDAEPAERPLTFAFNGGPGSSSIWLHMGLLGPRIVEVPSDGSPAGAPPYPLLDNPDTLLTHTDLVLVDPIGTGFSRVVGEGESEEHWGFDEDARSVARFVRRYLSEQQRWASPKYVLGESYGGIRGALLVRELQRGFDSVALNGLILVSPAFDLEIVDGQENDAAFATVLPTYAATAWYHDALPERPAQLEPFLAEVRAFVEDEYVPALFVGSELAPERRAALIGRLHRYTGLEARYLERADLRVLPDRFRRELLRERGLVVGRLDTRYVGTEADDVGELPSGDPMTAGISGAFVAAFHEHLARGLGVAMERDYVVMSAEAGRSWKRQDAKWAAFQGYVDVMPALARGMADNPDLRVFVASGIYDIATTAFAARHNFRRGSLDPARVVLRDYPAGHMMYVHAPTRAKLAADLRSFIEGEAPPSAPLSGAGH